MGQRLTLGSLAGLGPGILCWRGNHTAGVVSTFPDFLAFVAFAVLLVLAVGIALRRTEPRGLSDSLRAGLTVAAADGVVFGAAVVGTALGVLTYPAAILLAFGFFTALGSALVCGLLATLVMTKFPKSHRPVLRGI